MYDKLIFELSKEGRKGYSIKSDFPNTNSLNSKFLRKTSLDLMEVSELDVIRHYTNLSLKNYGVDQGFYPLGSCTMKYNPKINEELASLDGFVNIHPLQPASTTQGILEIYYSLNKMLANITGMSEFTFNPFAGAHGELTGLMIMKEYFIRKGELNRTKVIVPVSAHGTNPASCTMCGFEVLAAQCNEDGLVDVESLKSLIDENVAGIMLTNPNTVGLFEKDIVEIARLLHDNGSLLYYDGANLNAILGLVRPFDMGFDIMHINLHKTFSTPHGGGGPGDGPVGVNEELAALLPYPRVIKKNGKYNVVNEEGIHVSGFLGNTSVVIKAYIYLLSLGKENLKNVAYLSVLNANYIRECLKNDYKLPVKGISKHEVVFDGLVSEKASTLEVAKRLLDYGYHPPTIYFPLLFHQSLMIEPTECESKETLDEFIQVMKKIAQEAIDNKEILETAPHDTPVLKLDEVSAARNVKIKYKDL